MAGDDAPNGGTSAKDGMAINAKIFFLDGGGAAAAGVFLPRPERRLHPSP